MTPEIPDIYQEKPLKGKRAIVTNISQVFCAEAAISLAKEGVEIIGIVGNSRKEQEEAAKLAMHIEYSGNGIVDIVRANLTSPEDRERLQKSVGEKIDIFIHNPSGTNETAIDMVLPKMAKGGTVILIAKDREEGQLLRNRIPEFREKGVSFAVVRASKEATAEQVGKMVVEIIRGNDLS